MMDVTPRKGSGIVKIWREGNALFLRQEAGLIRLIPHADHIIQISYTQEESFPQGSFPQGPYKEENIQKADWEHTADEGEIILRTDTLQVRVSRLTGSLRFERKDGTLLLAEREYESKLVEAFDVYRSVEGQGAVVEEIETADGVKRRVKDAARVFDRKLYHTTLSLQFQPEEMLYGLGQAEEGVWNLRNTTQYLHQANLKIAVPVLVSNMGYGLMFSTQSPAIFDDTAYGSYIYTEADEYLDYFFIAGDMREIVRGYRHLTGKAVMLPRWAFGYMQSQERYESAEELVETAKRFRDIDFGMDTLVLDWLSWPDGQWGQKSFDRERFPDPSEMMKKLHSLDTHLMLSIWPNMTPGCPDYSEFKDAGLFFPNSNIYDAFSKAGRELYWKQVKNSLYCHGVDAWWCDSSEPVTPEWGRNSKPPAPEMYRTFVEEAGKLMPIDKANAYGLYHAMGIYEGQRNETEEKRVVNLTRSGYLGSQKYGTILWSGDIYASWETLKKQIVAGLQFCVCGLPYWSLDIGAFFVKRGPQWYWNGEYPKGLEDLGYRELYVRWFQYGAFLPIFRSHGTDVRREPWNFGSEGEMFYDALSAACSLRYRLMPYIYSLAGEVWRNDCLMMRPLFYDFPKDKKSAEISTQYMFGPALMICPVTTPMYYGKDSEMLTEADRTLTVYLPAGSDWYDLYTEERYRGGQEICVNVSLERIPVFVRAGSVLPVMEPQTTAQTTCKEIEVLVYAGADGSFSLYEDAGDGYGYERGEYCVTDIVYIDRNRSVEWNTTGDQAFRHGTFKVRIIG